jgi:hypothetical protein
LRGCSEPPGIFMKIAMLCMTFGGDYWGEGQTRDVCMSFQWDEKGAIRIEASTQTMTKEPF